MCQQHSTDAINGKKKNLKKKRLFLKIEKQPLFIEALTKSIVSG